MYSSAFNNAENLEGSVDPKTGSYSFRHTFGTVQANGMFGPKCNLMMSFSFLATMDETNPTGLGMGWSFKVGSYSSSSNILTLNSGASYQVLDDYHTKPWGLSHKVRDLEVLYAENDEEIHVRHKNGDLEIFEVDSNSGDAMQTQFISANGQYLRFQYRLIQNCRRLVGVYDSESSDSPLATVNYEDGEVVITTHPGTPDEAVSTLHVNDSALLYKIDIPDNKDIHFDYYSATLPPNDVSLQALTKVIYSTGATEEIEYNGKLYLPSKAPITYTPAVSKHTKTVASNQPAVVTTFEYEGDTNYWGGGDSGVTWGSNTDSLFNCERQYRYTSKSTCGDKVTQIEYNKFHQKLTQVETNGNASHKKVTSYEYYSDEHGVLDKQPVTYELTKTESVHYERDTEVSEKTTKAYEYDEFGNTTKESDGSEVCTVSDYYSADGEEGCPKHPFGLVSLVKKRTYYSLVDPEAEGKESAFTYQSIPNTNSILPLSQSMATMTKAYEYYDATTPSLSGIAKSETVTINGKSARSTMTSWQYDIQGDFVQVTEVITGYDGKASNTSSKLSHWTGLILSQTDDNGVVTAYTRDKAGKLTSETSAVGTDYESKTVYTVTENATDPEGNQQIGFKVEQVSETGSTVQTFYDAEENVVKIYQQHDDSTLKKVLEKQYDNQGRLVGETYFDYIIADSGEVEKAMSEPITYKFDTFGNRSEIHRYDDTVDLVTVDPIARTTSQQTVLSDKAKSRARAGVRAGRLGHVLADGQTALHKVVTTQDKYGNPISTEVFATDGSSYSKSTTSYDCFGRLESFTTPTGNSGKLGGYDMLDRPTTFELLDGTAVDVSYADFSTEHYVSSISIPDLGFTIGEQEYDGLSRIISRNVNGAKTQFAYSAGAKHPSSVTNQSGATTLFEYIPELDMNHSRVALFTKTVDIGAWDDPSKQSDSTFTYSKIKDSSLGQILSAKNSSCEYSYSYSKLGIPQDVTQSVGGNSQTVSVLKSTVTKRPVTIKVGKRTISYEYDEHGDVTSITDGDIRVELEEDEFGRLTNKMVKRFDQGSGSYVLIQTTATAYDEHSHEISRTISAKTTGVDVTMRSEYDIENRLARRVIAINDVDSLTESFSYDSRGRLVQYITSDCKADTLLPQNENGKPFVSQSFTFDTLDNITSVQTTFPNGDVDMATFTQDSQLKQRLVQISHTLTSGDNAYVPVITLGYDADGRLVSINDSKMTYTVSGRLSTKDGASYTYDPYDRLVKSNDTTSFYLGNNIVSESDGSTSTSFVRCNRIPICEIQDGAAKFYGVDHKSSVMVVTDDGTGETTCGNYSAYGSGGGEGIGTGVKSSSKRRDVSYSAAYQQGKGTRPILPARKMPRTTVYGSSATGLNTRIGFSGEMRDVSDSGMYLLGNGTRTLFPAFCGFSSADTFSPFLGGGINPFTYAGGNPVNAVDPSGHSFLSIFNFILAVVSLIAVPFTGGSSLAIGIGVVGGTLGVVSAGLSIGAEVASKNGNDELARKLNIASFALGAVSAVMDIGSGISGVAGVAKAGKAAKAAQSSRYWKLFAKRGDEFLTTAYDSKYVVRFRKYKVPEEGSLFHHFKLKSKKVTQRTRVDRLKPGEKKFGFVYIRKVREPTRVLKGGEYAGMKHILMKNIGPDTIWSLSWGSYGLGMGLSGFIPLMKDQGGSSGETDGEATSGCPQSYTGLVSAYGLPPRATEQVKAEDMLFRRDEH